ncbi:MAG: hypothetical protein JWN76_2980 [Chitinophagaceae bacterium]|nr:hypothetical protein [Chitinophagaceae bacterium]
MEIVEFSFDGKPCLAKISYAKRNLNYYFWAVLLDKNAGKQLGESFTFIIRDSGAVLSLTPVNSVNKPVLDYFRTMALNNCIKNKQDSTDIN